MAAAAAPVVKADFSPSGTARVELEKQEGEILAEQVPYAKPVSEVPVIVHLTSPTGPLQTRPSARQNKLLFGALNDPLYRLRRPIPLELSVEESEVVLTWAAADEFGYGANTGAALDDFGQTLRELYRRLHDDEPLGSDLLNVKRLLDEYIEPRTK